MMLDLINSGEQQIKGGDNLGCWYLYGHRNEDIDIKRSCAGSHSDANESYYFRE